eukprot:5695432-Prymnesium_polylepis.1
MEQEQPPCVPKQTCYQTLSSRAGVSAMNMAHDVCGYPLYQIGDGIEDGKSKKNHALVLYGVGAGITSLGLFLGIVASIFPG